MIFIAKLLFVVLIISSFVDCYDIQGPFSTDFQNWLESAGYADYNFPAIHLGINASFGGRTFPKQQIYKKPVIFIHGNSDGALDARTIYTSGWSASIDYFLSNGYTPAETYAVTWGDRNLNKSFFRLHSCATLLRIRRFVEAVIHYTNTSKIDIIAHSMGVTLVRQIIRGGLWKDGIETCSLGRPINNKIQTLVGIAGANYGLCTCTGENAQKFPACGKTTGFYAGDSCKKIPKSPLNKQMISTGTCGDTPVGSNCKPEYATNLMLLNTDKRFKEAEFVYSFWSNDDEIVGSNTVWGRYTSQIPNSDEFMTFPGLKHHELKTNTPPAQFLAVTTGIKQFARR